MRIIFVLKNEEEQICGEQYIIKCFISYNSNLIKIKRIEMGRTCKEHEGDERHIQNLFRDTQNEGSNLKYKCIK
jgi:hypothetical protein